ncbi:hypothetical protein BRD05_01040 [Halobacteriales archaeon QS_9_70_65]|nr:MAG: hypothetical protein BRD05_01040 [Halobacteriales archaeon QS_9_70_65]
MPPNDHDRDSLSRRLDAVERALSEEEPLERADRLDDLETRVAELEAAVRAIRGYVGEVRAINEDVERPGSTTSRRPDTEPDDGNSRTNAGADTDANVDADAAADADTDSTVDVDGIFRWG